LGKGYEEMSWEAAGAIGEIVAAFAVLITLVYLVKQIRHSTDVSKVTVYHEAIAQIVQSGLEPDFSSLAVRSQSGEALSPEEQMRADTLARAFIFGHEILLHLFRQGHVDEQLWENIIANNMAYLKGDMILPVLESRPGALSRELLKLIKSEA
jgi:hypothetical protein